MSETPLTKPRGRKSPLVPYTPSPSETPPSSPCPSTPSIPTRVDVTYQIVRVKPANTDWRTPSPSDVVQIVGPVSKGDGTISDDEEAAAGIDDGFEVPCEAHLTWGERWISLACLYDSSAALFTRVGGCADGAGNVADKAGSVGSVAITMQDAILRQEGAEDEMVEGEDVRDDNGNPFMVLHVNRGLGGSTRLYCKKVTDGQNGRTDGLGRT